jgi:hypothetical protein
MRASSGNHSPWASSILRSVQYEKDFSNSPAIVGLRISTDEIEQPSEAKTPPINSLKREEAGIVVHSNLYHLPHLGQKDAEIGWPKRRSTSCQ